MAGCLPHALGAGVCQDGARLMLGHPDNTCVPGLGGSCHRKTVQCELEICLGRQDMQHEHDGNLHQHNLQCEQQHADEKDIQHGD